MTTRDLIAANLRARMAFYRVAQELLVDEMGWSARTVANKCSGLSPVTAEELAKLAEVFGVEPGDFYKVPDGFAPTLADVRSRVRGLLPSRFRQPSWSETLFAGRLVRPVCISQLFPVQAS